MFKKCRYRAKHGARIKWLIFLAKLEIEMGAEDCRMVRVRHIRLMKRIAVY